MLRCPDCNYENPEVAKFCEECGAKLVQICSNCCSEVNLRAKFCLECGQALILSQTSQTRPTSQTALVLEPRFTSPQSYTPKHLVEKILTCRAALEGERKQVTVLFCDVVNSTALAERLGPEATHFLFNYFFELALAEVHRYEGTINQFLGDGFMALFGAPLAHEDHARRAVLAAIGIQQSLKEGTWERKSKEVGGRENMGETSLTSLLSCLPAPIQVRMGLNTGLVVVGAIGNNLRMDYTAMGDTTNLAARMQQLAEPGTILLTENTAHLVQGEVELEALGLKVVKGKVEPISVYRVYGVKPKRSPLDGLKERPLSRFVGREQELKALQNLLAQVESSRRGRVAGIVGEPGMGKSRLLYEFRQSLSEKQVKYLEGGCLSYGSAIPYLPMLDILRNELGITDTDSSEEIISKVQTGLQEVGIDSEEWAPYLLQLVGVKEKTERLSVLSPEAIKYRTFEVLRQMILKGSRWQPTLLIVEDLHWIDKTSEEYFASLVENLAGFPVLLLCTYRPEYRPPWAQKPYATQLVLHRLTPQDSLRVIHTVFQEQAISEPLSQIILNKAEGNPFFLEELAQTVVQGGFQPNVTIPNTIQGVLMARIDRLPDDVKQVLQTASVLGREFSLRLLDAIWDGASTPVPCLVKLKHLGFLHEKTGTLEPIYVFKHALTQEVAYESLLTIRRQTLHAAVGRALETLYADRLEEVYDRLAYHYARTEEAHKAIDYLTRFADRAAKGYSHKEALRALQEALVHVERLPAKEQDRCLLNLIFRQMDSLRSLGCIQESLDLLLQQKDRLERLQDPFLAGLYYFWLGHTYGLLGDEEQAMQSLRHALEEAERCGDKATLGKIYYVMALEEPHAQAVEHGRQAVALLEQTGERDWLGMAYWVVGVNSLQIGEFELALEAAIRAQAMGETTGDPRLQSYAAWAIGIIYATMGEWEPGIEACKRGLECSPDPLSTALASGYLGYAYLQKGDAAQAIPVLEQSVQQMRQFQWRQAQGWFMAYLSEAYLLKGQIEKAQELATQSLEIGREASYGWVVGCAEWDLGRIALARSNFSEAELHFKEALKNFSAMQMQFEVGRTYLALVELNHAQENKEVARQYLIEAYNLFKALRVPKYVEQVEQLAQRVGENIYQ